MAPLTPRQAEILGFIKDFRREHGMPPVVREIQARFGIHSPNGAISHLKALERKGYIRRDHHISRGIYLVRERPCPLCGGTGIAPEESP